MHGVYQFFVLPQESYYFSKLEINCTLSPSFTMTLKGETMRKYSTAEKHSYK